MKLLKKLKTKLKNSEGVTLLETLLAAAISVFIYAILLTVVQISGNLYEKTVRVTEAQTLCATLQSAIKDELRFASSISELQLVLLTSHIAEAKALIVRL